MVFGGAGPLARASGWYARLIIGTNTSPKRKRGREWSSAAPVPSLARRAGIGDSWMIPGMRLPGLDGYLDPTYGRRLKNASG